MTASKIEQTNLLGSRVRFPSNSAWQGIPPGRSIEGEEGIIESVYTSDESPRGPMYTVRLADGVLIEAHAGHFLVIE